MFPVHPRPAYRGGKRSPLPASCAPVGIIWYNGIGVESVVLCTISLAMLFAFLLEPHAVTALISLPGAVNWLFWGVMALGIGC